MKNINKFLSLLFLMALVSINAACSHDHTDSDHQHGAEDEHSHDSEETHEEGVIHLTKDQMNTMEITLGDFTSMKINDYVNATGTLGLPPNALTSVSAKANGFIVNSNKYIEGNYVNKGVIMAYLENPEFIQQQQTYLEVKAELTFAQQELERQQALVDAEAGVEKNLQRLQAEVDGKTAMLKGLAKQLNYLGLSVEKLTPDNIVQRIPLYAPMSGYLTSIKMHNGMYVSPAMELMEIVNETHLHLELDIFEKDIASIKEEQLISYTVPALGNKIYPGEVHVIGKEFNRENKTVRIHGHLEEERPTFIKDLFVEAKIWLNDQTVSALPDGAIIKDGASSYIYYTDEQTEGEVVEFTALMVIPGTTADGFTTVTLIDPLPTGKKVVTQGAYYVYAQSKASELEHSH
ncbi:MAG: efflux RND transporter periplasmic adaptor subunit [Lewinella sp.]|uniref:efflux RND transporter periplasmic adaptor subunit n=1 Tax=Lewinella sp. TaxID=2004506 RepID=UPI003D6A1E14